jgi:hypothetical protein
MEQYCQTMKEMIGNWQPLVEVSEKILAGEEARQDTVPQQLRFLVDWMKLIMQVTSDSEWDWTKPEIQAVYKEIEKSQTVRFIKHLLKRLLVSLPLFLKQGRLVH